MPGWRAAGARPWPGASAWWRNTRRSGSVSCATPCPPSRRSATRARRAAPTTPERAGVPALAMAQAHFHQVQADLRESYRALTKAIPDVMAGYGTLHDAAFVEGALDIKTKELPPLSIATTRECDGCIAAHGRNLARLGATAEEGAEMIGVAITMKGGPGPGGGPRALEAFLEYRDGPAAPTPPV